MHISSNSNAYLLSTSVHLPDIVRAHHCHPSEKIILLSSGDSFKVFGTTYTLSKVRFCYFENKRQTWYKLIAERQVSNISCFWKWQEKKRNNGSVCIVEIAMQNISFWKIKILTRKLVTFNQFLYKTGRFYVFIFQLKNIKLTWHASTPPCSYPAQNILSVTLFL